MRRDALLVTACPARLGSARRKHRFVYYCVIAGACFDVTILAWRKYATIRKRRCGKTEEEMESVMHNGGRV
jgi:hypothetical protein